MSEHEVFNQWDTAQSRYQTELEKLREQYEEVLGPVLHVLENKPEGRLSLEEYDRHHNQLTDATLEVIPEIIGASKVELQDVHLFFEEVVGVEKDLTRRAINRGVAAGTLDMENFRYVRVKSA